MILKDITLCQACEGMGALQDLLRIQNNYKGIPVGYIDHS